MKKLLPAIRLALLTIVLLAATGSFARQTPATPKVITGKITNAENEPLEGVTVQVKGKQASVTSNEGGIYSIPLDNLQGVVLVFSSVGYLNKEVKLNANATLYNVKLDHNPKDMEDVIVIGYGTVKKKDLTGSVGQVKMEEIRKAPVASFEDALGGRIAGVQVGSIDGQPGSANLITIRGGNSITQSNGPLYVIDGFPVESSVSNTLNPDDIESTEVLRDASATAIYGARGANGVILVTTKKGKIGMPAITYNGWYGLQQEINRMEVMSPYEFVKYQLELSSAAAGLYLKNGKTLESYRNAQGVDWQDQIFRVAPMQSHSLSLNGGNDKTRYSFSGSILDQDGILINSGFSRYQGRIVLDQTVNAKLKIGVNANYSALKTTGQIATSGGDNGINASSYLFYNAWGYRPITGDSLSNLTFEEDAFDPDITSTVDLRVNPIVSAKNAHNVAFTNALMANTYLEYKIWKDLTLRVTGGITRNAVRREIFNNTKTAAGNPRTNYGAINGVNGSINNNVLSSWLNENTLTWNKRINKDHILNVVGGFTLQKTKTLIDGFSANRVPNESLGISGLDEGTPQVNFSSESEAAQASFLGRINYNLKSKYLFTVSFRADGSSKFALGNKWGYFPSGGIAWRLSEEKFMKNLPFISDAKLRASYGVTGNNRVADFAYLSVLRQTGFTNGSGNTTPGYYFGNAHIPGSAPVEVGNKDLKWERTAQTDIGLDIGFLNNRIALTVDYYYKKTSDLLLNASMAPSSGYLTGFKNIGKVSNEGLEFTLNTVNINNKNFTWSTNFNISFNRNKILELNDNQPSLLTLLTWNDNFNNNPPYMARPGMPVASFYGYLFDGLYQLEDFDQLPNGSLVLRENVPTNGNDRGSIKPGFIKYVDLDGDGLITSGDRTVIGNPLPIHIGGFSNNFRYYNFDLNVFFQWSYGNDVLNANRVVFEGAEARQNLNMFKSFENRWSPENTGSLIPAAGNSSPNVLSTRVVEDGSYLRLKTVSLGYNIPVPVLKRIKIKSIRVYTAAQNLVTWTNYSGVDPEVSVRNSALTPGFDWSPYPKARTITLGVNVTF
ncbi:TonB-dependent receptor [Pseudoflavitalea sp. X16]|uniref:SusC/RagA family TonB-linked outer membrane protein n=1 Tax=Paraflavitalea devenefica TaxID=2716334 RepID=UPI001422A062|nr:TonB-dependent receptor [Paraflavitalea devenefica]NII27360.1 TonB-dependent receptor [Paraflavitalea devenefica]